MYSMQFGLTLWSGSVQHFEFLIKTIRHHDVTIWKKQQTTTAHDYLLYAHFKQSTSTQNRLNAKDTKHSTLLMVCKTNGPKRRKCHRAHSAQQKKKWSTESYALNAEGDKRHAGSQASNAQQNRNVTGWKSSGPRATQWKWDGRNRASSARRNGNGTRGKLNDKRVTQINGTVGKEWAGKEVGRN